MNHPNPRIEVNAENNNDTTAFMMACNQGHKDIVKILLEYPDINIKGYKDLTQEMKDFIVLYLLKLNWN